MSNHIKEIKDRLSYAKERAALAKPIVDKDYVTDIQNLLMMVKAYELLINDVKVIDAVRERIFYKNEDNYE